MSGRVGGCARARAFVGGQALEKKTVAVMNARARQVLENVSATTFNVMGNANKLLTLVANHVLWEHHASLQARGGAGGRD